MESAQGTVRLRTGPSLWSARLLCALVFSVAVGVCTYTLTYHALTLVMSTSSVSTVTPGTTPPPTAPAAPVTPGSPTAAPAASR